ncbi:Cyclin, C-terminal domain-containing protein [Cynara cardunculus var. scolymus]|uniref:Cyclin, C-terminal domain-containing protein n=1 Tax=Cynara cardunculus var. scolymus TaxID=59895 RepID=A0A118JYG8_CYNCS|nr:Cyclin, C-terminal domain-containing protein [Cynara cardunculus var. scolymus]
MKKFRSKLPRRRRSQISPILRSSPARKVDSSSIIESSSNLTRDVGLSCDSTSRVSTNNKSLKKRSFADEYGSIAGEFRRITRSYSKRMEIMAGKDVELSESSSCVELFNSSSKSVVRKGPAVLKDAKAENDDEVSVTVCGIDNSEVTTRSECSFFVEDINGRDKLQGNEETDVVSVSSRLASPQTKMGTTSHFRLSDITVSEGQSAYTNAKDYAVSVASRLKSQPDPKSEKITSYINKAETNKTLNDDQAENCGESKLISADFDLTCSEHFSCEEEECHSSAQCTDATMESSEMEFSSDYTPSTWYKSGSQFSERSDGDTTPSPTFQLFLLYRKKFCKSEFFAKLSSADNDEPSNKITKLLRPEDEEHEESYQMMRKRERRQVYLHDYAEEYCGMKEYGHLVVEQRLHMVYWIIEQSANKDLQKETMFLGVSLLDRFLSKGYFRNKKELQIAGIACLTLATRIEENQPFNSIRQKLFNIGSNEYSRSEVVAMEWLVQEVLNFRCYLPTIYNFLCNRGNVLCVLIHGHVKQMKRFYLKAARADQDVDRIAKYLAVLALLGHEQLCYWPSTVAASLVILACLADNEQSSHQQIAWV